MKEVYAYLKMLQDPMGLYFDYHNNVPIPGSDKIIKHYHILSTVTLGNKGLHADYLSLLESSKNMAVDILSDFYYEKIRSPDILQTVFHDLDSLLTGISERYRSLDIQGMTIRYSTRIVLQVEVAKEKCQWTNESFPFYTGLDFSDLTVEDHYQIITTLNEISGKEISSIESFRQVLQKFDKEPPKEVFHESLPDAVLKQMYEKFAEYLEYETEEEFVQAVNKLKRIQYIEGYSNHIAYLFHMTLKIHKIKGRSQVLQKLCGVKNKPWEQLSQKPILAKIDDFLKSFDDNIKRE